MTRASPTTDTLPSGSAEIEANYNGTRTVLSRSLCRSPLRLLTPKNHGHAQWLYFSTLGGGLLSGDALSINVKVGQQAHLLLSTQSSTKVFAGEKPTTHKLDAQLDEHASLIVLPDPTVCFENAVYHQESSIALTSTSNLVYYDAFTSGRKARGEIWSFQSYSSSLTITRNQKKLLHDNTKLSQTHGSVADRMRNCHWYASLFVIGPDFQPIIESLASTAKSSAIQRDSGIITSASPIADGIWLRVASESVEQGSNYAQTTLGALWAWLGDNPWKRRYLPCAFRILTQ